MRHPVSKGPWWILVGICLFPACGHYWENRLRDLDQCVLYDVQYGLGLSADVRVTRLAAGVGLSTAGTAIGKIDWWEEPMCFEEDSYGIPVLQLLGLAISSGLVKAKGTPSVGLGMIPMTCGVRRLGEIPDKIRGRSKEVEHSDIAFMLAAIPVGKYDSRKILIDSFGIEMDAFVGLGGFRLGFNVAEFADLLLGFTSVDLLGDDSVKRKSRNIPAPSRKSEDRYSGKAGTNEAIESTQDRKDLLHVPVGCDAIGDAIDKDCIWVMYRNEKLRVPKVIRHRKTGIEMVLVLSGTFMMGANLLDEKADADEMPRHRVKITQPLYLGKYEVTQDQWEKVMGRGLWSGGLWSGEYYVRERADHAASCISWEDAMAFCRKTGFRLPTEAEWEYACRAGSESRYCYGYDESGLGAYAWFYCNAYIIGEKYAHPVGRKRPNDIGLYDMHGNVWEWCSDWYEKNWYEKSSGVDRGGPQSGEDRVLRGGSWFHSPRYCRSSNRGMGDPSDRTDTRGFRVAKDP